MGAARRRAYGRDRRPVREEADDWLRDLRPRTSGHPDLTTRRRVGGRWRHPDSQEVPMHTYQYVQHDWPPFLWAVVLLTAATLFVVGMGLFLVGANRSKRARHSGA